MTETPGLFQRLRPLIEVAQRGSVKHIEDLGEPPWSQEAVARWEQRHGHDPRMTCLKTEGCGNICDVMQDARDRLVNAMGPILDALEGIRYAIRENVAGKTLNSTALVIIERELRLLDASQVDMTGRL